MLVVDETRRSGGVSEAVVTAWSTRGTRGLARVTSDDSFIPLGAAASLVLVSEQDVEDAALSLVATAR